MPKRMIRTIALAVGAGALVLGSAAPAMADDHGVGASKLNIPNGTPASNYSVAFNQNAPETPCPTNVTSWSAQTASKNMKAISVVLAASCANAGPNGGGVITVNIAAPAEVKKRNAVVKVIGTSSTDATVKVVKTIVVKVTGKSGNPGKGNKPA